MSTALDVVQMSQIGGGQSGVVRWTRDDMMAGYPHGVGRGRPRLRLMNLTANGLLITFSNGIQDRVPVNGQWVGEIPGGCYSLTWLVEYNAPGGTNFSNVLLATVFGPGEPIPSVHLITS